MSPKRKKSWGNCPKYKVSKTVTNNRFQIFSDSEDEDTSTVKNDAAKDNISKIPPIIVDSIHNFTTVFKLMGESCKYKRMSIGTKIIANSMLEYKSIIEKLKSDNMKFFTHPIKDNKSFKLMLFGLPQLSVDTIKDEFKKTYNIELVNIKEINTSRSNLDDALYMFEFNRDQVTKKEIFKIKYVYGIVVHWRNPLRRSRGPTQCSKCAMYGHGSSNCFRSAVCISCGGNHDYSSCQLNKLPTKGPVINKCYNCIKRNLKNVNHRADDPQCPARKEYLEIRRRVTTKNQPKNLKTQNHMEIVSSNEELYNARREVPRTFSKNSGKNTNNFTYAEIARSSQMAPADDGLSNEKLLEIYFEAIDALEKCQTKYDKLRVLGNMLRHVI